MTRSIAWLAIIALLLATGWYLLDIGDTDPTPSPLSNQAQPAGAKPAGSPAGHGQTTIERTTAPIAEYRDTNHDSQAPEHTFAVTGHCILASDGSDLADCTVQMRLETDAAGQDAPWPPPELATTNSDAAGMFVQTGTHDDWTDTVAVRIHKPGFVQRVARWQQPLAGTMVDLGDVPMLRAIKVTGTITDQAGVAVEGADMLFVFIELTGKHPAAAESTLRARSDAAGRFAFDTPAHPGEWWVSVSNAGALIEPRSVKLSEQTSFALRVVVERPDPSHSITGTVVDPAGRPLADFRLSASGEGFMGRGRSGEDGRFTVQRAGPIPDRGKSGTSLSVRDPNANYERVSPSVDTRVRWGKRGVKVVMRQRAGRNVRVVDPQGQAVEAYTLFAFRGSNKLSIYKGKTQRGRHEDGRCRLPGLPAGPYAVVVMPRGNQYASTAAIAFEVQPLVEANELLVTLPKPVSASIRVVGATGKPLAGSTVELLQSFTDEPPTAISEAVPLRACDQARRTPDHAVLATATTDATGTARIHAPPGSWHVRVTGTQHVPQIQPVQVGAPTTNVEVGVQAAAIVFGQVQPPAALTRLRELSSAGKQPVVVILTPDQGEPLQPVPLDDEGHFTLGGLPTGLYHASLRYWLRTGSVRADNVTLAVADVSVLAGERTELAINATALLPGTVQGRIVAGGEPLRDVHCFLRRNGPGPFLMLRIATDRDGRFTGVAPAGSYGFSMTYPAQPGPGWLNIVLPDEWQLAPQQTHTINFDVPLRRVRLRLLDNDEEPLADLRVKVAHKGYFLPGGLKTDAAGEVEIFPAPLAAFHVEVRIDGQQQTLGPFDLPAGETTGTIVGRSN